MAKPLWVVAALSGYAVNASPLAIRGIGADRSLCQAVCAFLSQLPMRLVQHQKQTRQRPGVMKDLTKRGDQHASNIRSDGPQLSQPIEQGA